MVKLDPSPSAPVHSSSAQIQRQVRLSEIEAGFALMVTLAVCVTVEWPNGLSAVGLAVVLPVAMAFSVHGLHNAAGLGRWNLLYLPLRVFVIAAGLAYSFSHYRKLIGPVDIEGFDAGPVVALVMEALTASALVAHEAHRSRLDPTDDVASVEANELVDEPEPIPAETPEPVSDVVGVLPSFAVPMNGTGERFEISHAIGRE